MPLPTCTISAKGVRWARGGHPWVYRDDVLSIEGEAGDVVQVAAEGRPLGTAFLSTSSKIALRWIERGPRAREPDGAFWRLRLERAAARRAAASRRTNAYRIVHDVADGFPGLVADRYGPVGVLQSTTAGMDRLLPALASDLEALLGLEGVVARSDAAVREKEGLGRETRVLRGAPSRRVWVREEGPAGVVEHVVDPFEGQKTGAYLDQRENRWRLAELARGRLLDLFAHTGLFALHASRRVEEAVVVDTSDPALAICEESAARNGFANIRTVARNVFDYLKDARSEGQRFDTIVLDPPAFARSRADVPAAVRGYREINRKAMEILRPGGILLTCSCSYNLDEAGFIAVLREAAAAARAELFVIERRGQASDHPVLLCHPEGSYLKCAILEKLPGGPGGAEAPEELAQGPPAAADPSGP